MYMCQLKVCCESQIVTDAVDGCCPLSNRAGTSGMSVSPTPRGNHSTTLVAQTDQMVLSVHIYERYS